MDRELNDAILDPVGGVGGRHFGDPGEAGGLRPWRIGGRRRGRSMQVSEMPELRATWADRHWRGWRCLRILNRWP